MTYKYITDGIKVHHRLKMFSLKIIHIKISYSHKLGLDDKRNKLG